ncbi:MAG: trypsin-like peptidase domain-containing protein [Thaumarchaeota archaeon]|nr:trypsin-like peptidase domain-containing protein [Nitrososphaerota archaeon]
MDLSGFEGRVTESVEKVSESLVSISSTRLERRFFGLVPSEGQGSGVILSKEGLIITNNHVIDSASQVHVSLKDGRNYVGEVVGTDEATDVAVIKVEATDLPAAELGDSESLKVGQFALAIGNALGLPGGPTVSMGVLSAMGRPLPGSDFIFEGLLQTDAAVNPGNSGGPLADIEGKVIGINSAMIPYAQGMGFAIPINTVKRIASEILEHGRVARPWIGISGIDLSPPVARRYGISTDSGFLIAEVVPGGPSDRAGLRSGDVVVGAESHRVERTKDLLLVLSKVGLGAIVNLDVNRMGSIGRVQVRPAESPLLRRFEGNR